MFSSVNPEWGTPRKLYESLDKKYNFTVDLCATNNNAKHTNFISPEDDFLSLEKIEGVGFMNPPYNKPEKPCKKKCKKKTCEKRGFHVNETKPGQYDFVKHAYDLSKKGFLTTVCLLPARTDTAIFHDFIWDFENQCLRSGVELNFLKGRVKFEDGFGNPSDPAPFPSMIVVFNKASIK